MHLQPTYPCGEEIQRRPIETKIHPERAERICALNAAKMERMFSKPFIAALEGHADVFEVLSRRPNTITDVASASWDGGGFSFELLQ